MAGPAGGAAQVTRPGLPARTTPTFIATPTSWVRASIAGKPSGDDAKFKRRLELDIPARATRPARCPWCLSSSLLRIEIAMLVQGEVLPVSRVSLCAQRMPRKARLRAALLAVLASISCGSPRTCFTVSVSYLGTASGSVIVTVLSEDGQLEWCDIGTDVRMLSESLAHQSDCYTGGTQEVVPVTLSAWIQSNATSTPNCLDVLNSGQRPDKTVPAGVVHAALRRGENNLLSVVIQDPVP